MQKSPSDPAACPEPRRGEVERRSGPGLQVRPGDLVRVRRRRWRIVDVRAESACQVLTLARIGRPNGGAGEGPENPGDSIRRVIVPFDAVEPIERPARPRLVTRRRWRRACRALIADHTPPGALRSGRRARIDLLPHQLEPALAVVRGLGTRLLLADAVGLGKTIQAGLVLSELRERAAADRALIVTPAGLREQWAGELAARFALTAAVVDARDMRRRIAALPAGVNPWSTLDVAIASIDYVKRPDIFTAAASCRWDVVIVDEAHGVAGDSDRHKAIAALAARTPYVLLLTATPHSGERRAFLSLCRLGQHDDPLLLFRRTRRDVRLGAGRRVRRLLVRPSAAELQMHAVVARVSRAVVNGKPEDDAAAWLALAVLNKRALSSARSLEQTVERRLTALESGAANDASQLALPLSDPDGETDAADRVPELAGLALGGPARERAMLRELAAAARLAAQRETKIAALVRFLDRVTEPVIVFTEYRDTLLRLRDAIGVPAAVLHGGLDRDARTAALGDFIDGRRRVLLTTDAAGEGLNLHHACRIVVTLELPWNPMRLEQRIGRVDRIGQRRTVHAVHLIARDTGEMRLLDRLRARVAQAQADVGAADPLGSDDPDDGDDRAVARFLIHGTSSSASAPDDDPYEQAAPVACVLRVEASAEAARLAQARRFMIDGLSPMDDERALGSLDADGVWLTFGRASAGFPRGRMLLILRAAFEDGWGRPIESTLVPVAIACAGHRWPLDSRRLVDEIVRSVMDDEANGTVGHRFSGAAPGAVGAARAVDAWREAALAFTRAFFAARLAREHAIAADTAGALKGTFQPGLFDRRAEHQRLAAQAVAADAGTDLSWRLTALEHASRFVARPAQLLLVLAS
jgi:superfamily II DNA or RNA helicase